MDAPHYLDHHSTTPCLEEVVEVMTPYFTTIFGNPSSITHAHGREAGKAVEKARVQIASSLEIDPSELYFTAGATESNNIAINGIDYAPGDHVLVSPIEHRSALAPLETLRQRRGIEIEMLEVDCSGLVAPAKVAAAIRKNTRLVAVMTANGEIGTIEPCVEIAEICRERGVRFHTDATQGVGRIDVTRIAGAATSMAFSAHKFYGPKGIGALVVRRGTSMEKSIAGGGQERGLRSGTINVPGVVGMARALQIVLRDLTSESPRLTALCSSLRTRLVAEIPRTFVNGPSELRLPGNLNVSFPGVDAEALMMAMRRFSLSSGSACSSGDKEPSHVLHAIGASREVAMSSIRIGMGRTTNAEVIELLVHDLRDTVERLRKLNA
jgi:cysteine desulfurase